MWKDDFLHWDPAEFSGVQNVLIPQELIWVPPYLPYERYQLRYTSFHLLLAVWDNWNRNHLYHRLTDIASPEVDSTPVEVHHDGTCSSFRVLLFSVFCKIDMTHFPFDTQDCRVNLGSMMYPANKMKINHLSAWPGYNSKQQPLTSNQCHGTNANLMIVGSRFSEGREQDWVRVGCVMIWAEAGQCELNLSQSFAKMFVTLLLASRPI